MYIIQIFKKNEKRKLKMGWLNNSAFALFYTFFFGKALCAQNYVILLEF